MNKSLLGYILGIISAMCYGLNPLFAVPLYANGMEVDSVLFFRFLISSVILAIIMRAKRISFSLKVSEIVPMLIMGMLMGLSSIFLFNSYKHIAVGIASTLLFVYPAMVAIINAAMFKERISLMVVGSIIVASFGIFLLSWTKDGGLISIIGIVLVMLSALSYAIYLVAINRSSVQNFPIMKLTFYVLVICSLFFLTRMSFISGAQIPTNTVAWLNVIGLAIFPTVVSLTAMSFAVRYIGSTSTAILGALEPLTGVLVGIVAFSEHITGRIICGIILTVIAITVIVTEKPIQNKLAHIRHINNGRKR